MQLNNRASDEFIDGERRVKVPLFMSDGAPQPLTTADAAHWDQFALDRQAEQAAQMDEYRRIGAATLDPMAALARVEQQQARDRATFDSMGRDGLGVLDAEYAEHSRQLGGQSAPVKDSAALDAEYLAYCRSLGA